MADSPWVVPALLSAGTDALAGEGMPKEAAALSREFGGEPGHHIARQVTPEIIDGADLVLAMAREHRRAIAKLVPRASRKTFTLREFARILYSSVTETTKPSSVLDLPAPGDFRSWLILAATNRGFFPRTPDADDVIDPYGRGNAVYRLSIEQIVPAVHTIMEVILGIPPYRKTN